MTAAKPRVPGVLVVGDINVDILARIETFPAAGEDCLVPELELHCGGVGANTAMALAHWGVPVRLCGTTGRDSFGELVVSCAASGLMSLWFGKASTPRRA